MGPLLNQPVKRGSCVAYLVGITGHAIDDFVLVAFVLISLWYVTYLIFLCLPQFVDVVTGLISIILVFQPLGREKSSRLGKGETLV